MEAMRLALEDSLRLQGYDVVSAASGEEALQLLRKQRFDLLLTDQAMPGLSGIELAEATARIHPDVPIVLLTTESQESKKQEGKAAGATGWIIKPFKPEQLLTVVRKVLG